MKKLFKNRKAFSLVELVVVILIIAILAAAVFLGGATVIQQSRESAVKTDLSNFASYVQDMMYANPKLQYHSSYAAGEGTGYNAATKTAAEYNKMEFTAANAAPTTTAGTAPVLSLLNEKYLTADFQMKTVVDSWNNPYLFSYDQVASTGTGESSSCVVVINSLGKNSLDETSDSNKVTTTGNSSTPIAAKFAIDMKAATTNQKAYDSADAFVKTLKTGDGWNRGMIGDDYGVVICMIDGAVSTAYYGF